MSAPRPSGLRARLQQGRGAGIGGQPRPGPGGGNADLPESLDRLADAGPRVVPGLGPHAIYTVSPDSLRWIAQVASERGIPIHIHLSETESEVSDSS